MSSFTVHLSSGDLATLWVRRTQWETEAKYFIYFCNNCELQERRQQIEDSILIQLQECYSPTHASLKKSEII